MNASYKKIINLPHRVSENRRHMARIDRAAQFAAFAALTGYGEAVDETARLIREKAELSADEKLGVNAYLSMINYGRSA